MPNRLHDALSPYLRQHAENPVDWWPWCDEAFDEARTRDVPVLLSVGYAACHWCHVMAHESFEDPRTAALLNERFVSVKVDREERPDIDAVYMEATQALTGQGGWPMTVFLDHEGRPFLAGTYFPPVAHGGLPSFTDVLRGVDEAWRTDRPRVDAAATQIHEALDRRDRLIDQPALADPAAPTDAPAPTAADVTAAVDDLAAQFDTLHGGFGNAPKFPPSMVLEFLLRADALTRRTSTPDPRALDMAVQTMRAMARGGMFDQLAGGFARYSVDRTWTVPHFEKMLYDNALLLRVYAHWWRATGDPLAERVTRQTAQFLLADLRTPQGGFASSLDADSEGREGACYVWTPRQLAEALGPDDGAWVAQLCAVSARGTFERGASVLALPEDPDDPARWSDCRARLRAARSRREQPARDDKVVTAWNGLAIAALAEAGALLDEPRWIAAATECAHLVVNLHWDGARLARVSLDGRVSGAPAVLEDVADLAEGLLALYQVTAEARWFSTAQSLAETIGDQFGDGAGGFHDTARDAPPLVRRPRDPTDGVTPAGASAGAHVLLTLGALTGDRRHVMAADAALTGLGRIARAQPRFAGWAWSAITARVAGPDQVAVVLPRDTPSTTGAALHRVALRATSPGLVVAVGREGSMTPPLLADRPAVAGRATAYPCRGFVCDLPVTDPSSLAEALAR